MFWTKRAPIALVALSFLATAPAPGSSTVPVTPQSSPSPFPGAQSLPTAQASPEGQQTAPEFFVMIDPAHGGADKGAILFGKVPEKEITLMLARELRSQLQTRGLSVRLLRDSDIDMSLERRATVANQEHAGIYIAVHAGTPGSGVRVYAPGFTSARASAGQQFLSWDSAQLPVLERSRGVARSVADELRKSGVTVILAAAPLRPLDNVVAPAIAVEWAPRLEDLKPQQSLKSFAALASGVAAGVLQARVSAGARP